MEGAEVEIEEDEHNDPLFAEVSLDPMAVFEDSDKDSLHTNNLLPSTKGKDKTNTNCLDSTTRSSTTTKSLAAGPSPTSKSSNARRSRKENNYNNQALYEPITKLLELKAKGGCTDAEFVGAYILLFLRHRHGRRWLVGLWPQPISVTPFEYPPITTQGKEASQFLFLDEVEGLKLTKREIERMSAELNGRENKKGKIRNFPDNSSGEVEKQSEVENAKTKENGKNNNNEDSIPNNNNNNNRLTIITVFQYWSLRRVHRYVNECIVNWGFRKRPLKLFHFIGSPSRVLNLQVLGKRCVSVFVKKEQLDQVLSDDYPPYEKRDVLNFLMHDLQHMEKLVEPKYYCEQVGFLDCMKLLLDNRKLLLDEYDAQFQFDFDHTISDMNACAVHLLAFLKAKWKIAHWRKLNPDKAHLMINTNKNKNNDNNNDNTDKTEGDNGPVEENENENENEKQMDNEIETRVNKNENKENKKESLWLLEGEGEAEFNRKFDEILLEVWKVPNEVAEAAGRVCTPQFTPDDVLVLRRHFHQLGVAKLGLQFPFIP